jgi:recombination protein RecA
MARDAVPSIASLIKEIAKKDDLRIGPLSATADDVPVVSTGNIGADSAVGVGGFPLGRSIELFGKSGSGKTTLALQTAAHAQQQIIRDGVEDYILYADYEHSLDKDYARDLGLDVDHESFLFCQPDNLEQGSNAAIKLIGTGRVRISIWDSVAAMTPSAMIEAEVGTSLPALQARLMSAFLQKMNPLLHEHLCTAIFLNHEREAMAMGGGGWSGPPRTTTPGGSALKFYASIRIGFTQVKTITASVFDPLLGTAATRPIATDVRIKVVKNKVGPPFRQALARVRFGKGFDNFWSALQILVGNKKIVNTGGYYYFDDVTLRHEDMAVSATNRVHVRGEEALLEFADQHLEWRAAIIDTALAVLRDIAAAPTPVLEVADTLDLDEPVTAAEQPAAPKRAGRKTAGTASPVRLITSADDVLGLDADGS